MAGVEAGSASVNAAGAGMDQAVSYMDDMTQQNAALVDQAAAAAASRHQKTANLARAVSVSVFRIGDVAHGPHEPYRYCEEDTFVPRAAPERRAPASAMRAASARAVRHVPKHGTANHDR